MSLKIYFIFFPLPLAKEAKLRTAKEGEYCNIYKKILD